MGAFAHYIETAMWSTTLDDNSFMDDTYDVTDLAPETAKELREEMEEFIDKYFHLVTVEDADTSLVRFAHNFWLTRNGHGAGFWDGDYKNGDTLTEACKEYKEIDLYVGDDGLIYST